MKFFKSAISLLQVRVFLVAALKENPFSYTLVVLFLQKERMINVLRAGEPVLQGLIHRYPFEALAYELKLADQYNPFPASLPIGTGPLLTPLPFNIPEKWVQVDVSQPNSEASKSLGSPSDHELRYYTHSLMLDERYAY